MAITGLVSTEVLDPLVDKLFDCGMEKLVDDTSTKLSGKNKVFLDGDWVGVCEDPISFVVELRTKRRHKELPQQVRSFLMHYEGFSDSQSSFFYPHTNFANVVMWETDQKMDRINLMKQLLIFYMTWWHQKVDLTQLYQSQACEFIETNDSAVCHRLPHLRHSIAQFII